MKMLTLTSRRIAIACGALCALALASYTPWGQMVYERIGTSFGISLVRTTPKPSAALYCRGPKDNRTWCLAAIDEPYISKTMPVSMVFSWSMQ